MTSTLGLRNGELGMPWSQLEYPPKAYTAMAIPATTATMGSGGSHSGLWAGDGSGLAAHIASAMPTPPESPPPGRLAAAHDEASHTGLTDETTTKLGLHNLLRVSTSNSDRYYLTRKCCYVFHCLNLKTNFNYPTIPNKMVIQDERVSSAIEQAVLEEMEEKGVEANDDKTYYKLVAQHTARAHKLLNNMKAAISSTLIRLTGYVLFKVFSNLLMSVTVHGGQQEVIERASRRDTPVIFVPLHRSHVDYLFVTWVLFNRQIPAPIVAAGDNLRIPVFGWLLRGLGGFFIKRRLESCKARKDVVYRSVLQTYVTHALQAGYNLEFFIEGGRTRTGKPCMPKGGLLSVIVDGYMNGTLDDALIVPIAINYDKLLDGNFIREQMGQSKVPESFWGAVRAIIKVLSTNYGQARIDFGQPFSLREFVQNSKIVIPQFTISQPQKQTANQPHSQPLLGCTPPNSPSPLSLTPPSDEGPQTIPPHPLDASSLSVTGKGHQRSLSSPATNNHLTLKRSSSNPSSTINAVNRSCNNLHGARSSSSLFGSEVTEEYRSLIKSLSQHIVHDAERCQAIMSTNAIAWLLLFVFRDGTTRSALVKALDALRESLKTKERDTGFSGNSKDVVKHAVRLLGAGLVRVEESKSTDGTEVVIKPITLLPNIIELSYYASALSPVFALDAIVATSLLSMLSCDLWSYRECSPDILIDREKLVKRAAHLSKLLEHEFILTPPCGSLEAKIHQTVDNLVVMGLLVDAGKTGSRWIEDSDEEDVSYSQCYKVSPSTAILEVIGAWRYMLTPMLDAYYCTACNLQMLVGRQVPDVKFIQNTQSYINDLLQKGSLRYGESICVDPIRNAVKLFESQSIIESFTHDSVRLLYLSSHYDSEEQLTSLLVDIDSFRS
ncbi:glycerol-3-phosphate acyltransferase 1, mitochondrial-like isoform X2 [Penaeus japonicus]|uniref:glycerol-3-phosphate acyltransferase 1, mitochondrial-like isoform X2 n=1 Tax=Penaeus japonicus TaxID=27405 RepID=UPI001C716B8F|nr:glycerol-3-phosphate acyltransferase 1, mitochondrial-like isoform X2 [Penaeus japonicus]XP_042867592.1 glycerol-3-phosphate acyltransferase 1, mitochondrial-like isoform X2 [Penaeus japonicus]